MDLFTVLFLFTLQTFIAGGNETSSDSECILTDIKSHLSIASQIIASATEKVPKSKIDAKSRNETSNECIFTDIKSRLRIASQIIETAKKKIPQDLKEVCKEFIGNECENVTYNEKPLDCSDIYLTGVRTDGIYSIRPRSGTLKGPLQVYCDMESNGGGWTVIQRRGDYGSPEDYFYRDWNAYKLGFGNNMKDFWIGNDNIFALTNQRLYQLRVDLTAWNGTTAYAIYDEFWISDEKQNYTLHEDGYSGTAGNSLYYNNGSSFSTKDRDNDPNQYECAVDRRGAWWYAKCTLCNLNGLYLGRNKSNLKGIIWEAFAGYYSVKETVMKIRPANFSATK